MKAMEETSINVPENWIVQGDFEPESGYRAMQQILTQPHRPTAVFCGGDIMAMGALCAADEMGLRVPQDISVIGYDNVRNARYFTPSLTTIHQPKDSLGKPRSICCSIASSASAKIRSRLKSTRDLSSAARWRTVRSATTAANASEEPTPSAPAATPGSAFRYRQDSPAASTAPATCRFAAVRQQAACGNGFSSSSATHSPLSSHGRAKCEGTMPAHSPAEMQVAEASQSGTTSFR